jgi:hypothetical protein
MTLLCRGIYCGHRTINGPVCSLRAGVNDAVNPIRSLLSETGYRCPQRVRFLAQGPEVIIDCVAYFGPQFISASTRGQQARNKSSRGAHDQRDGWAEVRIPIPITSHGLLAPYEFRYAKSTTARG